MSQAITLFPSVDARRARALLKLVHDVHTLRTALPAPEVARHAIERLETIVEATAVEVTLHAAGGAARVTTWIDRRDGASFIRSATPRHRAPHPDARAIVSDDGDVRLAGLALKRDADQPFTEADAALVHLFHLEVGGLLESIDAAPAPDEVRIGPRARAILACLLQGDSEKIVAARLALSAHTVHGHVKTLYRVFGVSSRAELLARCLTRADRGALGAAGESAAAR
jgi:DNA-binding CsgD family transcriptional regulator